eukprot:TRINITY_DN11963_c0_g1_i1.p1 TRINITY_DN11963_c0_g1~~TRINITY_DN11963_c0_g1_i1.p1  ORF type:complete len:190 (+),score=20.67 TRINITY_DN11963_c0_g1_i1:31-570(+)
MDTKLAYIIAIICSLLGWSMQVAIMASDNSVWYCGAFSCGIFECSWVWGWKGGNKAGTVDAMKAFSIIAIVFMSVSTIIYLIKGISYLTGCRVITLPRITTTVNKVCIVAGIVCTLVLTIVMIVAMHEDICWKNNRVGSGDLGYGIICEPLICLVTEIVKLVMLSFVAGGFGNSQALMG